jgi:hypothetical protein
MLCYAEPNVIARKGNHLIGLHFQDVALQMCPSELLFAVVERKLFKTACAVESDFHFRDIWNSFLQGEYRHISFYKIRLTDLDLKNIYFDF